jgi:Tol biopolymer transport system component
MVQLTSKGFSLPRKKEDVGMKILTVLLVLILLATGLLFEYAEGRAGEMSPQFNPPILEGMVAKAAVSDTATPRQNSVISPTSGFVLYSRVDGKSWLKDADGDRMILDGRQPRLSPDGSTILVRRWDTWEGDLYLYDLEAELATLIFESNDYIVGFSWSIDGSRIYFDYACEIYAMDPSGSNQQVIVGYWPEDDPDSHGCYNDAPDVNPMDGRIVWHNQWHGIGLATGDGQNLHWLNNTGPEDFSPRWSPDGEWIAFHRAGNLYKIRPDGADLTQLTFLSAPDSMSFWTGAWEAGGEWLLAPATVNGVSSLYAVATDSSGKMTPLNTEPSASPAYVGNAGSWDFHFVHLPLMVR